jgi:hypothetical protein
MSAGGSAACRHCNGDPATCASVLRVSALTPVLEHASNCTTSVLTTDTSSPTNASHLCELRGKHHGRHIGAGQLEACSIAPEATDLILRMAAAANAATEGSARARITYCSAPAANALCSARHAITQHNHTQPRYHARSIDGLRNIQ